MDKLKLSLDQNEVADDKVALSNAKLQLTEADLAEQQASLLGAGASFVSFGGAVFDTLVLSDADIPTAIDDVEFVSLLAPPPPGAPSSPQPSSTDTPEPATAPLLAGAQFALFGLRHRTGYAPPGGVTVG